MEKHKHHQAIHAYADGHRIEVNTFMGWQKIDFPSFDLDLEYRVAPGKDNVIDKTCGCNIWTLEVCPGKWEQGCDLAANEEFVTQVKKTKIVKLLAWIGADHILRYVEEGFNTTDGPYRDVRRVPSEDKEIEVEE